ncbi:hypothetical protein M407DRAFT_11385 [Tulasnella calospora MUT 4182]|uniref:Uncharacterized protein n=1 Tax=Tulasnella calospora MUT 4182 TaxID=1051891 RepID=A0A0C3LDD8_9AGAM|nr:hypothetical protein M407DRAFT_11385 [Tulasnella calospora MUT 4182]
MPALIADDIEMMDTARAIFAPELFTYDNDDTPSPMAKEAPNPADTSAAHIEHVTSDGAVHLNTQNGQDSEKNKDDVRKPGSFANDNPDSLLKRDAQPCEEDSMELLNPEEGRDDYSSREMYGTVLSPKTKKLIDRIENPDKREGKAERRVHLMVSGKTKRNRRK